MEPLGETGDPTLHAVQDVIGYYIHASDGDIGHVEVFLVSDPDWVIRYLIVDTKNWRPGEHVLVAPEWAAGISRSERSVTLEMTREMIEQAPEIVPDAVIDRPFEDRLHGHYQRRIYQPCPARADTIDRRSHSASSRNPQARRVSSGSPSGVRVTGWI